MKNIKNKSVFVGLSGGVDSAVSAALLKEATPNNFEKLFGRPIPKGFRGYDVTGVFIKAWQPFDSFDNTQDKSAQGTRRFPCEWKEDRRSAMRAAAVLDIPFVTLDLEKEYKKGVVDYMIAEYKAGRTPNPDVMCNKEIKFGHFLKFALKNGADYIATGHYARAFTSHQTRGGRDEVRVGLKEGRDKNKDQSYFLWTLTQKQLKHILFPVGHLQKNEVRKLAKQFGLPQAIRKDSQGLCFLGQIDMKEFLTEFLKPKKGKVLLAPRSFSEVGNEKGKIIGEHDGAILYTIGERHGFRVLNEKTESEPLYVVGKDVEKNIIIVAPKTTSRKVLGSPLQGSTRLSSKQFSSQLEQVHWIAETPKKEISCRLRYRQEKIPCEISDNQVIFNEPRSDISPGQSVVFYEDEICLGGGIIS